MNQWKRNKNFSPLEVDALVEALSQYKSIIESGDCFKKREAWDRVTEIFNAMPGVINRSAYQLRLKYKNMKASHRNFSKNENAEQSTAGRSPVQTSPNESEERLMPVRLISIKQDKAAAAKADAKKKAAELELSERLRMMKEDHELKMRLMTEEHELKMKLLTAKLTYYDGLNIKNEKEG